MPAERGSGAGRGEALRASGRGGRCRGSRRASRAAGSRVARGRDRRSNGSSESRRAARPTPYGSVRADRGTPTPRRGRDTAVAWPAACSPRSRAPHRRRPRRRPCTSRRRRRASARGRAHAAAHPRRGRAHPPRGSLLQGWMSGARGPGRSSACDDRVARARRLPALARASDPRSPQLRSPPDA